MAAVLVDKLKAVLEDILGGLDGCALAPQAGGLVLRVPRDYIVDILIALRDRDEASMTMLMDVCGVDYPMRDKRFDVVYQLLSLHYNWRLTVCLETDEITPVPSVASVYASAGWFEREVFDLFGITFKGHPDLRRILTDYDFIGHPLRRDFPLTGFTETRYDDLTRRVVSSEPVHLQQDYRAFDARSPWQGMTDVQKRETE
ncbi:MAG: NADH-quinone oxidoreductase subunit C [Alphaproteobacteria bacterium]|nr:NADH-quinone oxidoreductase subunit C [Alphaproteobacteria bacterium]